MKENALKELYIDELRDIYNAENQLTKALPKMAKAATSDELRAGFEEHLEQTKGHVERLERILQGAWRRSRRAKKCSKRYGRFGRGRRRDDPGGRTRRRRGPSDAGLIAAAQRVEHYEIAAYGCLRTYLPISWARTMPQGCWEQTLKEEKETDQKLTQLAEKINVEAEEEEEGGESEKKRESCPGLIVHDDQREIRWPAAERQRLDQDYGVVSAKDETTGAGVSWPGCIYRSLRRERVNPDHRSAGGRDGLVIRFLVPGRQVSFPKRSRRSGRHRPGPHAQCSRV